MTPVFIKGVPLIDGCVILVKNPRNEYPIDSYVFEVILGRRVQIVTYGCALAGEYAPRLPWGHQWKVP